MENLKGRHNEYFGDLGIDGRLTLQWMLNRVWGYGLL
jgi:hypothetical protein